MNSRITIIGVLCGACQIVCTAAIISSLIAAFWLGEREYALLSALTAGVAHFVGLGLDKLYKWAVEKRMNAWWNERPYLKRLAHFDNGEDMP